MLPSNGIGDTDKSCYPGSPEYKFKYGSEGLNTTDIKEYIRNPHKFNIKPVMDGKYYNLWSTDNERTMDKLFKIKDLRKRRPLSFLKCRWTQLGIPYTLLLFYKGKIIMLIYKYYFKKLLNYNSSILFY